MGRLHGPSASTTSELAREGDPYLPTKTPHGEMMKNICAMPQYKNTSPEELRVSHYINRDSRHLRDTQEATSLVGVHLNGTAVRDWERELSLPQDALSTTSLGSTRAPSPALTASSESTVKASSFHRDGQATPAPSEFGTPVLATTGLPGLRSSSQTPSSRGKEKEREETPVKSFAALSLGTGELPSTPAYNVTTGLWGRPIATSSSALDTSGIPPSPAAERYPSINQAERDWEAAVRDARHKKALLAQARAAYDLAISIEKAKFNAYSEARMKFDT